MTPAPTPTPRTDREALTGHGHVRTEFARTLERELAAAIDEIDDYDAMLEGMHKHITALEAELAALASPRAGGEG